MEALEKAKKVASILDEKKAEAVSILGIADKSTLGDYFVIATGKSSTQVKALADEVEYQLDQRGIKADHIEGRATGWIILEYKGIVVHIFLPETRTYYNLERLWDDGKKIDVQELLATDTKG